MTSFTEVIPCYGVDDSVNPPWMIVPAGGSNFVLLKDGAGLHVRGTGVKVEEVSRDALMRLGTLPGLHLVPHMGSTSVRWFRVSSPLPGEGKLFAADRAGKRRALLDISVLKKRQIGIAVNIVQHQARSENSSRVFAPHAAAVMRDANAILTPQVNVSIEIQAWHAIRTDLEDIRYFYGNSYPTPRLDIARYADLAVECNVYFVGKILTVDPPSSPDTQDGLTYRASILIADSSPDMGRTMAHEVIHFLGLGAPAFHDKRNEDKPPHIGGPYPNRRIPKRLALAARKPSVH